MKKTKRILPLVTLLLALVLSSCAQTPNLKSPVAYPPNTAARTVPVNLTITPPMAYPNPYATSTLGPTLTPSTHPYIDPEGWYSFQIPNEWEPTGKPNSFSGSDGFFETGYLPEMMLMHDAMNVCEWIANISTKNTYSISLGINSQCTLYTRPGITPEFIQTIIMNPEADYPQRFFYIKTDSYYHQMILSCLTWLRPVDIYKEPTFRQLPPRPEDVSFWAKTTPTLPNVTVTEYNLLPNAQKGQRGKTLWNFIPPEVPPIQRKSGIGGEWHVPDINEQLKPFGYELKSTLQSHLNQLYKNGVLLIDNIWSLPYSNIHILPSSHGDRIAFFVYAFKNPNQQKLSTENITCYLVQNNKVTEFDPGNGWNPDGRAPILYKDELLLLRGGEQEGIHLQVQNDHREVLFSFTTYFGASLPIQGFHAWNDHWILEVDDFLIDTGEIINQKYGFEEAFDWRIINNKSFYFFRKGQRVGISYDGKFLPLNYEEIAHTFGSDPVNDPRFDKKTVRFFGKRNDVWYYVIAEMK